MKSYWKQNAIELMLVEGSKRDGLLFSEKSRRTLSFVLQRLRALRPIITSNNGISRVLERGIFKAINFIV